MCGNYGLGESVLPSGSVWVGPKSDEDRSVCGPAKAVSALCQN